MESGQEKKGETRESCVPVVAVSEGRPGLEPQVREDVKPVTFHPSTVTYESQRV